MSAAIAFASLSDIGGEYNAIGISDFTGVGLVLGIERKLQLYPFTKTGCYNVRTVGSLDIENFFSTFHDLDPHGTGVLCPDDIPTAVCVAMELLDARLHVDPNRDHTFDLTERTRGKRKRKSGKVSLNSEPARNPLPAREHHKACECKILPHVRRGLKLDSFHM